MEDQEIIALYLSRDERAIRETDIKYGHFCLGISLGILGSHADAEECLNDTYLRTWNSIPPAKPRSLRAYVGRIIRNLSIDRYRQHHAARRNREMEIMLSELEECLPDTCENSSPLSDLLDEFLSREEPLNRKLFLGRYWHAHSIARLADYYGLSPNAVSLRLARMRERLRAYLEERGYSV